MCLIHTLNFQYSNSSNVPRYDRLQDTFTTGANRGLLRFADWYYGPQQRLLTAYELSAQKIGFFDELKVNINYQDIKESRQQRDYKRYDRFDSRIEKLKVFGATISARKLMTQHEVVAGVDMQLNDVTSKATRTNLLTNAVVPLDTRYPDGKNSMNYIGVFAQHIYKFKDTRFVLNDGIRLQYVQLKSNVVNNSFFNLPITNITQNNVAVTGNLGLVFNATKSTTIRTALSTAFRAPNIDDLAKIFESSSTARQVVIPNANLKPEYTYNAELSIAQQFNGVLKIEATGFYTYFDNGIIKAPFQLNGQDSIVYNGVKSQVLASQNSNNAYIYGATFNLQATINNHLNAYAGVSFTKGRFKIDETKQTTIYEKQSNGTYALVKRNVATKPLDHIPPTFGKAGVQFENKLLNTDLFVLFNGWKRLDQYNPDGEDNAVYATKDGSPAWFTLNLKNTITINKYLQATISVENIFDRNYRYFASGFSAAGRNFQLGVRAQF
ncbi:TonB-dependent receptor [Ferruginibacter yonginensis]|uniref:TonB-dependent receptor n=1 Tax=Ferruginibacter yonginensis TaxID=1310416 RepID=A0ABV8QS14_9BACT